jgi:hypothetical protein
MQASTPAIILLSVQDRQGKRQENIKLVLYNFGKGYVSENLELQTGCYQLIQFAVMDAAHKVMYATPTEGSDLAEYVTDPLPMAFVVTNEGTQVIPQVLIVPGYEPSVDLDINLRYPDLENFDSAFVVFRNSTSEIRSQLLLNNSTHIATGNVASIPCGEWKVSTSYFGTITKDHLSLEKGEEATLQVTSTSTDLISDEVGVYIKDEHEIARRSFEREDYYYYKLYLNGKSQGFVRLPVDPINPFVQISTFESKWIYAYADRTFYNSSLNGTSNFLVGSGAFEVYGKSGVTHDRLGSSITDRTSLKPVISKVQGKVWNNVDCVIMIYGLEENEEILLFHRWDLRASSPGGRMNASSGPVNWSKAERDDRRRMTLKY